jgi:hypothetical protein
MSNIILLFVCMLIGMALRRYGRVPENAHTAINGFIVNVSLSALTLCCRSTHRASCGTCLCGGDAVAAVH